MSEKKCIKLSDINYNEINDVNENFQEIYKNNYFNSIKKKEYCKSETFSKLNKFEDNFEEAAPTLISGIVVEQFGEKKELIDLNDNDDIRDFLMKDVADKNTLIVKNLKKINEINIRKIEKEVKILLISKIVFTNTQEFNFQKFVLNYCKVIVHNKFILTQKLREYIFLSLELIGGCDWNHLESLRNKWVDDKIREKIYYIKGKKVEKMKNVGDKEYDRSLESKYLCLDKYLKEKNLFGEKPNYFKLSDDSSFHNLKSLNDLILGINNINTINTTKIKNWCIGEPDLANEKKVGGMWNIFKVTRDRKSKTVKDFKDAVVTKLDIFSTSADEKENYYEKLSNFVTFEKNNIINSINYLKYNFISKIEVAKTVEKTQYDSWWSRTPSIVAYSILSTTTTVNSLNYQFGEAPATFANIQSNMNNENFGLYLGQVMHIAMGPLIGLAVGVIIGSIIESKWFKGLRTTRLQNLKFQDFITEYEEKNEKISEKIIITEKITEKGSTKTKKGCIYADTYVYLLRFKLVELLRVFYERICYKYFDAHIENIQNFCFIYETIYINETGTTEPRPNVGVREEAHMEANIEAEKAAKAAKAVKEAAMDDPEKLIDDTITERVTVGFKQIKQIFMKGYLTYLYQKLEEEKLKEEFLKIIIGETTKEGTIKEFNSPKDEMITGLQKFYKINKYPERTEENMSKFYGGIRKTIKHRNKKTKRRVKINKRRTSRK